MSSIVGIENLTNAEITEELDKGARFVVFSYTISILVMTFKRSSAIHFVRAGESAFAKGAPYTLLTLAAGWWGFPWGPIYSIMSLAQNFGGGKDITSEVRAHASR